MRSPGKRFVKGQVANPKGGASHNPIVKQIRKLSQNELEEVGALVVFSTVEKLKTIYEDPTSTGLKVWMASIVLNAIKKGDVSTFNAFCDRLGLKQVEKFKHELEATVQPQVIVEMPSNGRELETQRVTEAILIGKTDSET